MGSVIDVALGTGTVMNAWVGSTSSSMPTIWIDAGATPALTAVNAGAAGAALMVSVIEAEAESPPESVTVAVMVCAPGRSALVRMEAPEPRAPLIEELQEFRVRRARLERLAEGLVRQAPNGHVAVVDAL